MGNYDRRRFFDPSLPDIKEIANILALPNDNGAPSLPFFPLAHRVLVEGEPLSVEICDKQREEDLKWWKLIWNKLYDAQRGDVLSKRVGEYLSKPKKHHFVHS